LARVSHPAGVSGDVYMTLAVHRNNVSRSVHSVLYILPRMLYNIHNERLSTG